MIIQFDKESIEILKTAKGEDSYRDIAGQLSMSPTTINNLFNGMKVNYNKAKEICQHIGYDLTAKVKTEITLTKATKKAKRK